jgi:hypothetical protein
MRTPPSPVTASATSRPLPGSASPGDALGHRFHVVTECTDPALQNRLAAVVSPLAADVEPEVTYSVTPTGSGRYRLSCDERTVCADRGPGMTARFLAWHLNRNAVASARPQHTVLHAAGARRADSTVVLAAPMGCGKSTTVAGLLAHGWDYITDEAVAVRREDLRITPYPKALSLDPGSWRLFPRAKPSWADRDDRQWQVPAAALGARDALEPAAPTIVVLPRFTGTGATCARRVGSAEAVTRLARCTFGFPDGGVDDLTVLVRIARTCPVYSVEIADLASAVRCIERLAEEVA